MDNINNPAQLPEGILRGISDAVNGDFASKEEIRSAFLHYTTDSRTKEK